MPHRRSSILTDIFAYFTPRSDSTPPEAPNQTLQTRTYAADDATEEAQDDAEGGNRERITFTPSHSLMTTPAINDLVSPRTPNYASGGDSVSAVMKSYSPEKFKAKRTKSHSKGWAPRDTLGKSPFGSKPALSSLSQASKRKSSEHRPITSNGPTPIAANGNSPYAHRQQSEPAFKRRRTSSNDRKEDNGQRAMNLTGEATTPYRSPGFTPEPTTTKRRGSRRRSDHHSFDMSNGSLRKVEEMMRTKNNKSRSEERRRSQSTETPQPQETRRRESWPHLSSHNRLAQIVYAAADDELMDIEDLREISSSRQGNFQRQTSQSVVVSPETETFDDICDSDVSLHQPRLPVRRQLRSPNQLTMRPSRSSSNVVERPSALKNQRWQPSPTRPAEAFDTNDYGSPDSADEEDPLTADQKPLMRNMKDSSGARPYDRTLERPIRSTKRRSSTVVYDSDGETPNPRSIPPTKFNRSEASARGGQKTRHSESRGASVPQIVEIPLHNFQVGSRSPLLGYADLLLVLEQAQSRFNLAYTQNGKRTTMKQYVYYKYVSRLLCSNDGAIARLEFSKHEGQLTNLPAHLEFKSEEDLKFFIETLQDLTALAENQIIMKSSDFLERARQNKKGAEEQPHSNRLKKPITSDRTEMAFLERRVASGKKTQAASSGLSKRTKKIDDLQSHSNTANPFTTRTRRSGRGQDVIIPEDHQSSTSTAPPERTSNRLRNKANNDSNHVAAYDTITPSVEKYSEKYGLGTPWKKPLVYPQTGPNKVTVDFDDLKRLDEDEFLNDNLIQFFLRYIMALKSNTAKIYIFNTYFYTTLTNVEKGSKAKINYSRVQRWTSKIDLFSYDYVIVPINESYHWYAAIICNLQNLETKSLANKPLDHDLHENDDKDRQFSSDDKTSAQSPTPSGQLEFRTSRLSLDPSQDEIEQHSRTEHNEKKSDEPRGISRAKVSKGKDSEPIIIMLDSFGMPRGEASKNLKHYLIEEGRNKKQVEFAAPSAMNATGIPFQTNSADCGIYLIGYILKFFDDPQKFVAKMVKRSFDKTLDWQTFNPHTSRGEFRKLLQDKYQEQNGTEADKSSKLSTSSDTDKKTYTTPKNEVSALVDNILGPTSESTELRPKRTSNDRNERISWPFEKETEDGNIGDDRTKLTNQEDDSLVVVGPSTSAGCADDWEKQLVEAADTEADSPWSSRKSPTEKESISPDRRRNRSRSAVKRVARSDGTILD